MVVANAVAALSEIQELGGKPVLDLTLGTVSKLLRALNECTEWGQVSAVRAGSQAASAVSVTVYSCPRILPWGHLVWERLMLAGFYT
jgi:hypothetical protein